MARLTRKQKQEQTRSCLMKSAARVFARRGMSGASIDEVAEDAGYTKGAFYANFKSKEELFLAMLDESFSERIAETDRAFSTDESPPEQARHSAADFAAAMRSDPDKSRLGFEFAAHAMRSEPFREELLTRFSTLRGRMEAIFRRRMEDLGLEPVVALDRMVLMVISMAEGWKLWQMLDPEVVDDAMLEEMMEIFVTGFGVMSGALEVQPARA
ncbi:MAG TPA: TetR/AcrR family transcriptional regulator [Thermoleophilaceae bacterium]|nr:TetR/AcrR family transcriptional regulator [Thermoleophilaceae bacterium]